MAEDLTVLANKVKSPDYHTDTHLDRHAVSRTVSLHMAANNDLRGNRRVSKLHVGSANVVERIGRSLRGISAAYVKFWFSGIEFSLEEAAKKVLIRPL